MAKRRRRRKPVNINRPAFRSNRIQVTNRQQRYYLNKKFAGTIITHRRDGGIIPPPFPSLVNASQGNFWNPATDIINGTLLRDYTPTGNQGDVRPRQDGRCLLLNGATQAVGISGNSVNITGDFTACIWIKPDDMVDNALFGNIFNDEFIKLFSGTGDVISVNLLGGTQIDMTLDQQPVILDEWNHVVVRSDGVNLTTFVNGVKNQDYVHLDGEILRVRQLGLYGISSSPFAGRMFSAKLFDVPLTEVQIIKMYFQGIYNDEPIVLPTGHVAGWYLDDNSTTTSLDNSGNGHDATITNGAAGMLVNDGDVPWSPQNLLGYSDGPGDTYLPKIGASDYSGRVPRNADLHSSFCGFTDVNVNVTTGSFATAAGEITVNFNTLLAGDSLRMMVGTADSGGRCFIGIAGPSGLLVGGIGDDSISVIIGGPNVVDGLDHTGKLTWDGATVKLFLDGVEIYSGPQNGTPNTSQEFAVFAHSNGGSIGSFFRGSLWDVTLPDGTHYNFSTGNGTTIYDTSPAGNHGTLFNATLPTFWSLTNDTYHRNMIKGFDRVGTFDGVGDYILTSIPTPTFPFSIEAIMTAYSANLLTVVAVNSLAGSGTYFSLQLNSATSDVFIYRRNLTDNEVRGVAVPVATHSHLKVDFLNATDFDVYQDGVLIESIVGDPAVTISAAINQFTPGIRRTATPIDWWDGIIADAKLTVGGEVVVDMSIDDAVGTTVANNGTGNDGTLISGDVDAFWNTAGRIPAADDGTSLVGRETLSNPPGGYNGNETKTDFTAGKDEPWAYELRSGALFDGISGYVTAPISLPTFPFTMSCVTDPGVGALVGVVSSSSPIQYFTMSYINNTTIQLNRVGIAGSETQSVVIDPRTEFHEVKVVIHSETAFTFYIDDEVVGDFAGEPPMALGPDTDVFAVGTLRVTTPIAFFDGTLFDAKLTVGTDLIVNLPLLRDALDHSGLQNNGTIVGGVSFPITLLETDYVQGDVRIPPNYKTVVSEKLENQFLTKGETPPTLTPPVLITENMEAWFQQGVGITAPGSRVSLWADSSGNGRDLIQADTFAQPIYSNGNGFVNFPGEVGSNVTVPGTASGGFVEIEVFAYVEPRVWSGNGNRTICARWNLAGDQRGFLLRIDNSGKLHVRLSSDGTANEGFSSNEAVPFQDGEGGWIQVKWFAASGRMFYYYGYGEPDAGPGSINWQLLGPSQTFSQTNIFNSTADFEVGTYNGGTGDPFNGLIHRLIIKEPNASIRLLDYDPKRDAFSGAPTWVSDGIVAEVYTVNGNAEVVVTEDRKTLTFDGIAEFMKCLPFPLTQPCTVYISGKTLTWTENATFFDGDVQGSGLMYFRGAAPNFTISSTGNFVGNTQGVPTGQGGALVGRFDGLNSLTGTSLGAGREGPVGINDMNGFTLATRGDTDNNFANIEVAEILVYSAAHTPYEIEKILKYLVYKLDI